MNMFILEQYMFHQQTLIIVEMTYKNCFMKSWKVCPGHISMYFFSAILTLVLLNFQS